MGEDVEGVRSRARERIADVTVMRIDGDPIEELARAHERHAERLELAVRELDRVGAVNYLGDTSEGRAATNNYRLSAVTGEASLAAAISAQIEVSRKIADLLRATKLGLTETESSSADAIGRAAR